MAAALVLALAAAVQGAAGFGYSLLALPLLLLLMPVREAVPLLSVTGLMLNAMVLAHARRHVRLRTMLPVIVAGCLALPLGVRVLELADDRLMRAAVGLIVLGTALSYLAGLRPSLRAGRVWAPAAGALSGILYGATTFSGPPVVLYLAGTGTPRDSFRGGLALHFLVVNVAALPLFSAEGLLPPSEIPLMLPQVAAAAAGAVLGMLASGRIPEVLFRRLVLLLLALLGVLSAATALRGAA